MRNYIILICMTLLLTTTGFADPISVTEPLSLSVPVKKQLKNQLEKVETESGPQVWLVTRGEYAGVKNEMTYAFGVGLKFKRHNWRLMYWPPEEKIRLDFQIRVD